MLSLADSKRLLWIRVANSFLLISAFRYTNAATPSGWIVTLSFVKANVWFCRGALLCDNCFRVVAIDNGILNLLVADALDEERQREIAIFGTSAPAR
jgi:uncharacterized protein YbaR (Trm112 family)